MWFTCLPDVIFNSNNSTVLIRLWPYREMLTCVVELSMFPPINHICWIAWLSPRLQSAGASCESLPGSGPLGGRASSENCAISELWRLPSISTVRVSVESREDVDRWVIMLPRQWTWPPLDSGNHLWVLFLKQPPTFKVLLTDGTHCGACDTL